MNDGARIESGELGRLCVIRLRPNQDLTEGIEAACLAYGIARALVRAGVGSLNDANFDLGRRVVSVEGPGLEILTLSGEVRPNDAGRPEASLAGAVCDAAGRVLGGHFRRGENIVCITLELLLQEWIPA